MKKQSIRRDAFRALDDHILLGVSGGGIQEGPDAVDPLGSFDVKGKPDFVGHK